MNLIKSNLIPPISNSSKPDSIFSNSNTKSTLYAIQTHLLYIFEKCPLCNKTQNVLYGYLNRVCTNCLSKYYIFDGSHNRILIGNLGIAGGIHAVTITTDSSANITRKDLAYKSVYECYIKGIPCLAQECRYGGIIIQSFIHNQN